MIFHVSPHFFWSGVKTRVPRHILELNEAAKEKVSRRQ